tara:strand:- start:147 stop:383 length:237 start_codon:yes stop_codon:yes gene_type:complete
MFYSQDIALWGFIAHIPIAVLFLAFLSRIITLRDRGESVVEAIFDDSTKKVLGKFLIGGAFGLALIVTLSPISRFFLS